MGLGLESILNGTGDVSITEHHEPVRPEALPPVGRRVFDEYGPFGVVKYELDQDVALLQSMVQNYS